MIKLSISKYSATQKSVFEQDDLYMRCSTLSTLCLCLLPLLNHPLKYYEAGLSHSVRYIAKKLINYNNQVISLLKHSKQASITNTVQQ